MTQVFGVGPSYGQAPSVSEIDFGDMDKEVANATSDSNLSEESLEIDDSDIPQNIKDVVGAIKELAAADMLKIPQTKYFLTPDEMADIAKALYDRHSVFYKFWRLGSPRFITDPSMPTACIAFDDEGKVLAFLFNLDFWNSLTFTQRVFVILHECRHVILGHPHRTVKLQNSDKKMANLAQDIVINEDAIEYLGFKREEIDPPRSITMHDGTVKDFPNGVLCWMNTIFKPEDNIPPNKSFEFYYAAMKRIAKKDPKRGKEWGTGNAHGAGSGMARDSHEWEYDPEMMKKIGEFLNKNLEGFEKDYIKREVQRMATKVSDKGAATSHWVFNNQDDVKVKEKWETVINIWVNNRLKQMEVEKDQFIFEDRKLVSIAGELNIPTAYEVDIYALQKFKIPIFLFMDSSGSCWDLKDRFFRASLSFDPELFDIRLFTFDTQVYETTLQSGEVYGGGGTAFQIIEDKIQELIIKDNIKYPEAVFMLTDGEASDDLNPEYPDRFYVFLTEHHSVSCLPQGAKTFKLADYE